MTGVYGQDCPFKGLLSRLSWSYRDLSRRLDISERTVKRWAREEDMSPGKKAALGYLRLMCHITNQ